MPDARPDNTQSSPLMPAIEPLNDANIEASPPSHKGPPFRNSLRKIASNPSDLSVDEFFSIAYVVGDIDLRESLPDGTRNSNYGKVHPRNSSPIYFAVDHDYRYSSLMLVLKTLERSGLWVGSECHPYYPLQLKERGTLIREYAVMEFPGAEPSKAAVIAHVTDNRHQSKLEIENGSTHFAEIFVALKSVGFRPIYVHRSGCEPTDSKWPFNGIPPAGY